MSFEISVFTKQAMGISESTNSFTTKPITKDLLDPKAFFKRVNLYYLISEKLYALYLEEEGLHAGG